jgi:transcriptional regulator with XRE-family HTH domain
VTYHPGTIRALRVRAKLTQAALAAKAGIAARTYWRIEHGDTPPEPHQVAAIAAALGVDPAAVAQPLKPTKTVPVLAGGKPRNSSGQFLKRLSDAAVRRIRKEGGTATADRAAKEGVSVMQLWRILNGRSRKGVV